MSGDAVAGPAALDVLLVKQEIRDAMSRYCRAMDRRDEALAASIWHEGGTAVYGDYFDGTGAQFAEWVTKTHEGFERHSHQVTNVLVEVGSDGETAVSESYVTVALWSAPVPGRGVTQVTSRARYLDRWERRDGRWGIVARLLIDDATVQQVLTPMEVTPPGGVGRRDPQDPSYALFASLR